MDQRLDRRAAQKLRLAYVEAYRNDLKHLDAAISSCRSETARMGLYKLRGVIEAWLKEMR